MKCTDCSNSVLPIVAVDMDGTLSEYHMRLAIFACDYHDRKIPLVPWDGHGNYEDFLGLTQAEYREAKLAYRQGGYKRTAPLMPHSLYFMKNMRELPVELWITTARPWSRLDSVDPDTKFWLARHKIHYDHLLFDDHKYKKLSEIVDPRRVLVVVDDLPEMLEEAAVHLPFSKRLRVERPHNRFGTIGIATDLYSAVDHVMSALSQWNDDHGLS